MPIASGIYYHLYHGKSKENPYTDSIVLIHGAGGNYLTWALEIRRLSGYNVYTLDLPGHGRSNDKGLQSIDAYAKATIAWMDVIKLNSVVFVGHSMGAAIALALAIHYPERTKGIILIGGGATLPVAPELLEDIANPATYPRAINQIIEWSFNKDALPKMKETAKQSLAQTRPSVLLNDFIACNEFDVTNNLSTITAPALILCGTEDKMTPIRMSKFLASNIPNAEIKLINNAGHMVIVEKPQEVASAMKSFLETVFHNGK